MWVCIVQGSILNLKYTDEDIFNKKYKTLNKYDAKKNVFSTFLRYYYYYYTTT